MRQIVNINNTWSFLKDAKEIPTVFLNTWEVVNLPHTWNAIDGMDGGADYFRGTCQYAKMIKKAELPKSDRYFLEINGANSSADVYVNGKQKAHHDGGYSTWRVDITEDLEEETLVVIAVDNAPNDMVYPQVADFTFYGGIYRDVNIVCVNDSHFDLEYFGGKGLVITLELKEQDALVRMQTYLTNKKENQTIQYQIKDAEGNIVAETETAATETVLTIPNVHRWHGRKDPYLYTAVVTLKENTVVLDTVTSAFGCRTFRIDPENGFILNGEEYPLRGVSRHQDRIGLGNALLPEHHEEDMDLICEVGATTIRLAHYQHDQYFYDLCDQKGMIVWAEIPYISSHMATGRENTISQMKELIVQNYNHPSIVVWGLSNEITINGAEDADLVENHRVLNELVHEMDKTRLTTMAIVSMCPMDAEYIQIPDTVSWNHYFGWYGRY
ncbi:MAG: glycoside hydrolase family 2 TIM barrel-domain containing protein [Ruminococcus sp.]|nr:glycoside hydrolase family 2 TIM barrel-domain containing protein [Ruminococcus sp.]